MCGRFQLSVKGKEIAQRYQIEVYDELHRPQKPGAPPPKGYNCAPMQWLAVITNQNPHQISYLRWGLLPPWAKDEAIAIKMINSRIETIMEKPAFRKAIQQQRCLIPANGFYEWGKGTIKQPYRFFVSDEMIFSMAGIWEQWKRADGSVLKTFSILTTQAVDSMKPIHQRMPVILSRELEKQWLSLKTITDIEPFLNPLADKDLQFEAVSTLVNKVQNDGPELLNPHNSNQLTLI
ncbi:MAG: SOS response-associated peptidase [Bacteroidales bacterium]|jgi:putative SOS response-associated peptidase YedK|nr:SOS response-associated peptidase [Bacteroidales bacterium]MDY0369675.1 SOS response-associated peptidase [Bacteroidales bacterium]